MHIKCMKKVYTVYDFMKSFLGKLGALWGLTGVLLLLGSAVYRLTILALGAFSYPFHWIHWTALFGVVLFMAYAEGYRGFQQRFSPRVAARARYLMDHPRIFHLMLAPFFCMGFLYATKRRKITSYSVTTAIICLIIAVRFLSQPWRGIIDAGVVIGLLWGIISLLFYSLRAFFFGGFAFSPDIPSEK